MEDMHSKSQLPSKQEIALALASNLHHLGLSNVLLLDVIGQASWCDYIIIATSSSYTLAKTAILETALLMRDYGLEPSGAKSDSHNVSNWLVLDGGDYVLHVLNQEKREFYELEKNWPQAKIIYNSNSANN